MTNSGSDPARRRVDVVGAVRNEEPFLPRFIERVDRLALPDGIDLGMIFVEDSSTDGTVAMLRSYAQSRTRFRYFTLRRGYGQCAAIALGLRESDADAVIMMDADGEHPPEVIPEMLQRWLDGDDAVQGVRVSRDIGQAWRRFASAAFNAVAWLLTGVQLKDQNVYFRLVSRDFLDDLVVDNKWLHFLRIGARHARGRRIGHVRFDAVTTAGRTSTYGLGRLIRLASDALLSLVSTARLVVIVVLALALATVCFARGFPVPGGLIVAAAGLLVWRYAAMARRSLLGRLEIVESGP